LPPSRPPSASPTAPVAFADSEPVTFSVPVSGVANDSTSCAPEAAIGPREAIQPISAFCRICEIGLSALPAKERAAPRSAASRIADSATAIGAITVDARGAGGSGGNSASAGGWFVARGATKSITFRLTANETMTTASAIEIVLRCIGRRIVPPDPIGIAPTRFTAKRGGTPVWLGCSVKRREPLGPRRSATIPARRCAHS
jgi:hypothetical protein